MTTEVDLNLCQAYGICAQLAPTVFELDDDGYAHVVAEEAADPARAADVAEAARACPVQAVVLGTAAEG